jgi:hypothetical protein
MSSLEGDAMTPYEPSADVYQNHPEPDAPDETGALESAVDIALAGISLRASSDLL